MGQEGKKTLEDHFKELAEHLNFGQLIKPRKKDKISALEKECRKGIKLAEEIKNICQVGANAAEQLAHIENTFPAENIGNRLLDEGLRFLRKAQVNVYELGAIVNYISHRVDTKTTQNEYTTKQEIEKEETGFITLTESLVKLAGNEDAIEQFTTYITHYGLQSTWEELPKLYEEFKEIVLNAIIPAGKNKDLLEVRTQWNAPWEKIRHQYQGNEEGMKWIDIFEALEKKYPDKKLLEISHLYKAADSNL